MNELDGLTATAQETALTKLRATIEDVLTRADGLAEDLITFYSVGAATPGSAFAALWPNDPADFTGADAAAVSLWCHSPGADGVRGTRAALESGPTRSWLLAELAQVPSLDLAMAPDDDVRAVTRLVSTLRTVVGGGDATTPKRDLAWAARKRPGLVPLGLPGPVLNAKPADVALVEWLLVAYRELLRSASLVALLDATVGVARRAGRSVRLDTDELRLLETALYLSVKST